MDTKLNDIISKISEINDKPTLIKIFPLLLNKNIDNETKEKIILKSVKLKIVEIMPYLVKLFPMVQDDMACVEKIIWAFGIIGTKDVCPFLLKILQSKNFNDDIKMTAALSLNSLGFETKISNIMNYFKLKILERERRKTPRINIKIPVIIIDTSKRIYGFTFDISKGGLNFISLNEVISKESVQIFFPSIGQNILFRGIIIAKYVKNNLFFHHIKFYKIKQSNKNILFNYSYSLYKNELIKPELYIFPGSGTCRYFYEKISNKNNMLECWNIMEKNYYYDTGLSWIKLKCHKCPVFIFKEETENQTNLNKSKI